MNERTAIDLMPKLVAFVGLSRLYPAPAQPAPQVHQLISVIHVIPATLVNYFGGSTIRSTETSLTAASDPPHPASLPGVRVFPASPSE